MAAVTRPSDLEVRAASPGEGRRVASLWRELWDAHEAWGGYAGSHDRRVYDQLAARLEQDARVRAGQPVLGRHIHLIASYLGEVAGQVEGWFERHGIDPSTPYTCEVRSLIVREPVRKSGAGRALLDTLAETAVQLARGAPVVLAAEVLEPNPAHAFYAKVGYAPVSWSTRLDTTSAVVADDVYFARIGEPRDALAIARLEAMLASRRRHAGDLRFDRPRAIDATFVGAIAAHLAHGTAAGPEPLELVATDSAGIVRGAASFSVSSLEPPFVPMKRALLGRFALDPTLDPGPLVTSLVGLGCRLAALRGAPTMELTDLTSPGTRLHDATVAVGARPWSRIVTRLLSR
jgi:GNAT superfamily N-acetyltransferase